MQTTEVNKNQWVNGNLTQSKYIMDDFKKFLSEQLDEQPYKLVIFHNSHENIRDVGKDESPDVLLLNKTAKAVGIELFNAEYSLS